ncbi:hypothetical protein M569_03833 [Genlisea aurea]|uniref:Uncharacterized protein n=1 Tax=Genlisea aurea TaxID=192259 RepID=S8CU72_9LAMI|nr:hypothetical protein M569_03833 [Genlisea aurea]
MSLPAYFPLRWESAGDQWWYVSPVDWAAANGYYEVVNELLRLDANNLIKLTSLRRIRRLETVWDDEEQFHDVAKCRWDVARKLFVDCEAKRGKDSLIRAGYGGWLLYTSASAGDFSFLQELLRRFPLLVFGEREYGVTDALYAAARSKNSEVFKLLLDFASAPRISPDGDGGGETVPAAYKLEIMCRALHAAARGGNLKLMKDVLGECSDDALAYRDIHGATILHSAAAKGRVEVVNDLIASSPEMINSLDNRGNTPLHVAAHRGHLPVVEALIQASPSSIAARNNAGDTFLHSVIAGFKTPCFRRMDHQKNLMKNLLSGEFFKIEEIINTPNAAGKTPLHLAITENVRPDIVELLLNIASINVNIRDDDGLTPIDIIRRRPRSPPLEVIHRRLISSGEFFTWPARKVIVSDMKKHSMMGKSPGTSFRISDVEIFLYTGLENPSAKPVHRNTFSLELFPYLTPPAKATPDSRTSAESKTKKLRGLLHHWPKMKKTFNCTGSGDPDQVRIPLRQKFSKRVSNNKRPLSVRSTLPSPTPKKKLASEGIVGLMAAVPRNQKSRSSSFSQLSFSSVGSSMEGTKGGGILIETAAKEGFGGYESRPSPRLIRHRRIFSQYLCFGGRSRRQEHRGAGAGVSQRYDIYARNALSAA